MPTAAASISWLGALGWLAAIAAAGFLVAWVLTSRLGVRRTLHRRPGPGDRRPHLGLPGLERHQPDQLRHRPLGLGSGRRGRGRCHPGPLVPSPAPAPAPRVAPDGRPGLGRRRLRHAEGLLLSVLPVLVTWQAFAVHGWTSGPGRSLVAGIVAMGASLAVIVVHHLGYRGFHTRAAWARCWSAAGC